MEHNSKPATKAHHHLHSKDAEIAAEHRTASPWIHNYSIGCPAWLTTDVNKNSDWKFLQLNIFFPYKAALVLNTKISAQLCETINYQQ